MDRNLAVCLGILIFCALGGWCLRPRNYSIGGVRLGDRWSGINNRFPHSKQAPHGMQMGAGDSRLCRAFAHYRRCIELKPEFIIALDPEGLVEAVEGAQLELNGQPILGPQDSSEKAEHYLGKFVDGGSSDADYLVYADDVFLRTGNRVPALYALYALRR